MDGNRRYAKSKGLLPLSGHRAGYMKLREVLLWAKEAKVREVIVYAFSTENWQRSAEEVGYLMSLFREVVGHIARDAKAESTRLIFLGEHSSLAGDIQDAICAAEDMTRAGDQFTLAIALSYGGRKEIIDAIHRIPKGAVETISEEAFAALLWTSALHDPDLIIRTGGEGRLSNFLPWQSVYSELIFTKTLWPEFSKEEFLDMLKSYTSRDRRMGK